MKLAYLIILSACASAFLQTLLYKLNILKKNIKVRSKKGIFMVVVLRFGSDWESVLENIFDSAEESQSINVGLVLMCTKPDQIIHIPRRWQHQVKVLHLRETSYSKGVQIAIDQLMESEEYIVLTRGIRLVSGWDTLCVQTHRRRTVLCAPPSKDMLPTFPTLSIRKNRVHTGTLRKMQFTRPATTPCVTYCNTFVFLSTKDVTAIDFVDNPLKQTLQLNDMKLVCPCFPCVKQGTMQKDECVWEHVHPGLVCGLTQDPDDEECIYKYGSIEAANLQYEFGRSS